jgi:hypothetical protein
MLERGNERKTMTNRPMTNTIHNRIRATVRLVTCVIAAATTLNAQQAGSNSQIHELLYVIDTDHQDRDGKAQVLVVDPLRKVIVKTYRAGYHPDLAVSHDGKRLYLSSSPPSGQVENGTLEVIDTTTGTTVASVSQPDRVFDTFDDVVSHMALSGDGHLLYVARIKDLGNGEVSYGVAVFDADANKFLPDVVSLPRCDAGLLLPSREGRTLSVICPGTRDVRTTQFDDKGVPLTRLPAGIPLNLQTAQNIEISTAFQSGDNEITVVLADGSYSRINLRARKSVQQGMIEFSPPLKANNRIVGPYETPVWQGKILLVIAGGDDFRDKGLASAVAVLNLKSFQQEDFIEPGKLFSNVAIGSDGTVFLADPSNATIYILGLPDGTQKDKIEGIGVSPTIVIPSP